jgi:hypothetical protein
MQHQFFLGRTQLNISLQEVGVADHSSPAFDKSIRNQMQRAIPMDQDTPSPASAIQPAR